MGIFMTKRLIQTRASSPNHAKPPLRNATVSRNGATESLSSQAVDPSCVSTGLPPPAFFAK